MAKKRRRAPKTHGAGKELLDAMRQRGGFLTGVMVGVAASQLMPMVRRAMSRPPSNDGEAADALKKALDEVNARMDATIKATQRKDDKRDA